MSAGVDGMGMTQTLLLMVLLVAALAALPWLIRRLQQQRAGVQAGMGAASRVLSAVAVGPQQRVVTVEVGPEHARTWLVLGVTGQTMTCLHVMPATGPTPAPTTVPSFAQEVSAAVRQGAQVSEHA